MDENIEEIDESESESKSESKSESIIVKKPKLKQTPAVMYGCMITCIFLFVIFPIMIHIFKLKRENNNTLVINNV